MVEWAEKAPWGKVPPEGDVMGRLGEGEDFRDCSCCPPRVLGKPLPVDLLIHREKQVFVLLGYSLTNHQIAARLRVTERTAKAHVCSILEKLDLQSRVEAGVAAVLHHASACTVRV